MAIRASGENVVDPETTAIWVSVENDGGRDVGPDSAVPSAPDAPGVAAAAAAAAALKDSSSVSGSISIRSYV